MPVNPSSADQKKLQTLYTAKRYREAASLARLLVQRFPEHGLAWKILGAALEEQGHTKEAMAIQKQTAALRPTDHEAHFNLACALQRQGRLEEAAQSYLQALRLRPDNALAYNNLGVTLRLLELLPDAETCCRQAVALAPHMAKAHNNLGNVLNAQGKYEQAEACFRQSLALQPGYAEAYNNLAIVLKELGHWEDAKTVYRHLLTLRPDWAAAHSNLLFCLSHDLQTESGQLFADHLAFGQRFEPPLRAGWRPHPNSKDPARRLQIGFVSGDFYNHAVTTFLEPLLEILSKKPGLSLHAYHTHTHDDDITQRLRTYFPHWHAVALLSEPALADQIRADGIDILIDLSGHTAHNRLLTFARKPAPVQASWLGYPGTTGLQAMDYYLCDRFWLPPGELDWQLTEKPAFLPNAVVFEPSAEAPAVNPLPALTKGPFTFGSFNRTNKINPSVIALWSMLLRDIPSARILLAGIPADRQAGLVQSFSQEGIAPERLTFHPRTSLPAYLALHQQVDLCLDTYPYGGGTTTLHAAWMGIPTLCLAGDTPPSRFGATVMHHLGLDAFIATRIEDFVAKGRYWAAHMPDLAAIRAELRVRFATSHLGQAEAFANHFEAALRAMWARWCQNLPPATLAIQRDGGAPDANSSTSERKSSSYLM